MYFKPRRQSRFISVFVKSNNFTGYKFLSGSKVAQYFCDMQVWGAHITWPKPFKRWKVSAVVGSIVAVGVLTRCALLDSLYDLKAAWMNVRRTSLISELMLYEFDLDHSTAETSTNIRCVKGEGVTRWLMKKDFAWVAKTSMIRQSQVGIKTVGSWPRALNQREQMAPLAIGEYQISSASLNWYSPVWFITFQPRQKYLYLTWLKYCKIQDLRSVYIYIYIYYMVVSVNLEFMLYALVRQNERFSKKTD